jgi:hypothetical protein
MISGNQAGVSGAPRCHQGPDAGIFRLGSPGKFRDVIYPGINFVIGAWPHFPGGFNICAIFYIDIIFDMVYGINYQGVGPLKNRGLSFFLARGEAPEKIGSNQEISQFYQTRIERETQK